MYKISNYLIIVDKSKEENPFYLIYSTKTGGFCSINKELIEDSKKLISNPNDTSNILFNEFYKAKFIVEMNIDESSEVVNFHNKYINDNRILNLTIIPTENCNFSCPYCFIFEKRNYRMNGEIYNSIIKFVDNNSNEKTKLKICLFGGEPTLEKNNILNFMKKLNILTKSKHFESIEVSMVTNGYLLDKKSFLEYYNVGICDYQITLDGYGKTHDNTRYLTNMKGTFNKIWQNLLDIKSLDKKLNFNIVIRNNFLKSNLNDSKKLLENFIEFFGDDDRFSIYFRPVYYFSQKENTICKVENEIFEYEEGLNFQKELEILYKNLLVNKLDNRKINFFNLILPTPIPVWCTTQLKNFFVISANGDIFKCDTYIGEEDKSVGKLTKEGIIKFNNNIEKWNFNIEINEKCVLCKMLPICQGGCQRLRVENFNNCYWNEKLIKKIMINHYYKMNEIKKGDI